MSGKGMFPKRRIRAGSVAAEIKHLRATGKIVLPGDLGDDYPSWTLRAQAERLSSLNFYLPWPTPWAQVVAFSNVMGCLSSDLVADLPYAVAGVKDVGVFHVRFLERPTTLQVEAMIKMLGKVISKDMAIEWSVLRRCRIHEDCLEDRELAEACFDSTPGIR